MAVFGPSTIATFFQQSDYHRDCHEFWEIGKHCKLRRLFLRNRRCHILRNLTVLFERAIPKTAGYGVFDPFSSFFYEWYDIVVNVKFCTSGR